MQQNDQRPVAGLDLMQPHVPDLGVALPNFGPSVTSLVNASAKLMKSPLETVRVRTRLVLWLQRRARGCPGLLPGVSRSRDAFSR